MVPDMFNNPFVECTARDMEYEDVNSFWCQPYEYYDGLDEVTLKTATTPIFVEGARGSGKTMILKHLSYFCIKSECNFSSSQSLIKYFQELGSIGIYYRFKNDFGKLLAALHCDDLTKNDIFEEYFQLYYSRELILVLQDLLLYSERSSNLENEFSHNLSTLFGASFNTVSEVIPYINKKIENIDFLIRRLKYITSISEEIQTVIEGKQYLSTIFSFVRSAIQNWKEIKLLILIDEYENISAFQKTINTYVKQTDNKAGITYRIGFRPEGMITYATSVGSEQLQINRDYISMQLQVTNSIKFQRFLKAIANKRLQKSAFFIENNITHIEKILGRREDWIEEALDAVKNRHDIVFSMIDSNILKKYNKQQIAANLSYPDNPLLEMLNMLWLSRGRTIDEVHHAMQAYLSTSSPKELKHVDDLGYKYYLDYQMKYKYSLLFSLLAKCGIRKKYYSFTTFSYLACGSVNDFLSLCRNTIMAMDDKSYECLIQGKPIPKDVQDRGARESAAEQLDKVRLCEDSGTSMYTFAMNIGEIFSYYHRDPGIQFPETNQFAFENETEISMRHLLDRDLKNMIKWGVILKKRDTQRISIGRRHGKIYYLNRLLAPIFGISYRTRGGYNVVLKTDVFEEMLNKTMDASVILNLNKQKKHVNPPKFTKDSSMEGQLSFFGGDMDE